MIALVQYWRSFDDLARYARARDARAPARVARVQRVVRDNGTVGIFHETYVVGPGRAETLYVNMPPYGLGAAVGQGPIAVRGQSAGHRMDPEVADVPAVEPY